MKRRSEPDDLTAARFLEALRRAEQEQEELDQTDGAEAPRPSQNENARVYGPPDVLYGRRAGSGYDPASNKQDEVYGPPEVLFGRRESGDFDPTGNVPDLLYGPPEDLGLFDFEPVVNKQVEDYGPPDFDW